MATIGLCMIIRDEVPTIEHCLESTLPIIDYACIVDAGSVGDTVTMATRFLQRNNVAHHIYHEAWRDFASNKNAALRWVRRKSDIDYCLALDAGNVVQYEEGFDQHYFKNHLQHDVYDVRVKSGHMEYGYPVLFENTLECYYRGKLREFMVVPSCATRGHIQGFQLEAGQNGEDERSPQACLDEAHAIEQAMEGETDPFILSRYCFYLGQCYMGGGDPRKAMRAFHARIDYGGWDQEIFISLLRIARLMAQLGYREERVVHAFLKAWSACPRRAEPLCDLAAYSRMRGQWRWARLFAANGMHLEKPTEDLFVETDVYAYRLLDEYALATYACGSYKESLDIWTRLLMNPLLPVSERERIVASAQLALTRL